MVDGMWAYMVLEKEHLVPWATGATVHHTECSLSKGDLNAYPHSDKIPPTMPNLFQNATPNTATLHRDHFLPNPYS